MSVSLDAPHVDPCGKVLHFPVSDIAARRLKSMRGKYLAIGMTVAVLLIGGIGALIWFLGTRSNVRYVTAQVIRGAVARTSTATGTVNPVLTIIVGTYVSGVIQDIYCDYNTHVRAGQICAKIDPRPYQATLDQYTGQLARDQAIIEKDRQDLARYQQLAAQNSIARQQAEDQAFMVNQDEGTVKLDQALVESAKLNLNYTDIVSPVDGTVVSRNVTGGQTVAASFQTPTLFLIATDLKQMEVDTNTSEGDMGGIKVGDKASFTVDAYPQRMFHGAVTQVRQSPNTVQNVVTYDVVIGIDNSDLALVPGMTASTEIVVDERDNVLRVPDQALRYAPTGLSGAAAAAARTGQHVWVLRNGQAAEVSITTGLDDGNFTEVVQGELQEGDLVITAEGTGSAGRSPSDTPPPPRI
ncbi:MAG TPA: efflux RND transporter periplasmic adaptor subunit [Bradyrhizobium sp.]|nr:efflux RND transporter periplasmic adaptor subunit [Bradyrhizobium sp.]